MSYNYVEIKQEQVDDLEIKLEQVDDVEIKQEQVDDLEIKLEQVDDVEIKQEQVDYLVLPDGDDFIKIEIREENQPCSEQSLDEQNVTAKEKSKNTTEGIESKCEDPLKDDEDNLEQSKIEKDHNLPVDLNKDSGKDVQTSELEFACSVCKRKYADKSHLIIHMKMHAAERPYGCDVCGRTFLYTHALAKHRRTHTREPYTCSICSRTLSTYRNLKTHMKTQHEREAVYR